MEAALANWRTAPVNARVRGALEFLAKLTLTPSEVGKDDVLAARAAGISDNALREVIYVCTLLSTMDRLADAFGFPLLNAEKLRSRIRFLAPFGYRGLSG